MEKLIRLNSACKFPAGCCSARMCIECKYLNMDIGNDANQFLCMRYNERRSPKDRGCICTYTRY